MSEASTGICLLGCGIVGGGVVKILTEQAELLRQRIGVRFDIRHVVVRDPKKHAAAHPGLPLSTDAIAAIDDPKVQIVVELMGGTSAAGALVERALKLGKPVVTANKSLLAARGPELFALARKHNTAIAFEASCGGGIPIIDALSRGLVANRIDALVGIVNGTCNVILTRMTRNGWSYAQALEEAQKLGFAEADPTLDVSGRDAAQKLAILAGLAFNARVSEADIHVEGIDKLHPVDIQFATDLGYVIKLLAIGERDAEGRLTLRVHPTLVHKTDVLAEVSGSFNAISIYGNALGHALFYGRGAGRMPTASAVVADLVGVATGATQVSFKRLNIYPDSAAPAKVLPFEQLQSRYYLRLTARDVPGVLAQITHALGEHGISLSAVLQREADESQYVPVVITTHLAKQGAMRAALQAIDALPTIQGPSVCLRVIDQPKEFANG
ncbi:MAG: homoserine dehydrogenase [Phycisphaerales bacterium]|jgi:homoserine dehydrogenase|nr:homoserine dehydrogenase [Phycisphaerales bacterium]